MIFLSVGTQEPFDRLAKAVDDWAATHDEPVFGQLGAMKPESYRPAHFEWCEYLSAGDYLARLQESRALVAHVGMGSIITALTHGKPLVMLARRASLGEHRNEHQLATAGRFRGRPGLHIAADEGDVGARLDAVLAGAGDAEGEGGLPPHAAPELVAAIRDFLHGTA